jgi:16S rRNA C967 or C1407 C5-methylase (RsmB/RsmF family)
VHPGVPRALADQSRALLRAAAELVAHDGVLVFSVCTINATETSEVAGWAARELHGFSPLPAPGGPWRPHGHGALLLPQVAGTDGMFIARFHRS